MMMRAYLALQDLMVGLDNANDKLVEEVRDLMDKVWLRLTPDERASLDPGGRKS